MPRLDWVLGLRGELGLSSDLLRLRGLVRGLGLAGRQDGHGDDVGGLVVGRRQGVRQHGAELGLAARGGGGHALVVDCVADRSAASPAEAAQAAPQEDQEQDDRGNNRNNVAEVEAAFGGVGAFVVGVHAVAAVLGLRPLVVSVAVPAVVSAVSAVVSAFAGGLVLGVGVLAGDETCVQLHSAVRLL